MAAEFFHAMFWPFMACLVLAGIHAYLGFHVIERGVIFVDLALAQMAALGSSIVLLWGFHSDGPQAYWASLLFTIFGAAVFSLTRFKKQALAHEVIIGITYAVCAALLIMIHSRCGEGDEHIRQSMIGNILLVRPSEVLKMLIVYAAVGVFHFIFRKKIYLISTNPEKAFAEKINVRLWDFLFYISFGFVVTSSVKIAGVLLVFAFLVVPSACAVLLSSSLRVRLWIGWAIGFFASVSGMLVSYGLDFPTGASVVCVFGGIMLIVTLFGHFFRRSNAG